MKRKTATTTGRRIRWASVAAQQDMRATGTITTPGGVFVSDTGGGTPGGSSLFAPGDKKA